MPAWQYQQVLNIFAEFCLNQEHACLVASICLSEYFENEVDSLSLLEDAITKYKRKIVLVGLAKAWPNHELLQQHWNEIDDPHRSYHLGWTGFICLTALLGTSEQFVDSIANFSTRARRSPWDFPLETINAVRKRTERDGSVINNFEDMLRKSDNPSIRASLLSIKQILWTNSEVANYIGVTYKYANEYIVTHHTFPNPIPRS